MYTKSILAALLLAGATIASPAAASPIYFYDGAFGPAWAYQLEGISAGATEVHSATTPPTGGHPAAYEAESHTLISPAGGGYTGGYWSNFDPANAFTGTFASLAYSYDLKDLGSTAVGYSMAVKQNNVAYAYALGNQGAVFPGGWGNGSNPYFATGLLASDFCKVPATLTTSIPDHLLDCTSHPDFSNPAMSTQFGITVENSFGTGPGSTSYSSGIDNWCVQLQKPVGTGGGGANKKCAIRRSQ